ncbi:rod shape-determining protein MreC [Thalassotalea mangrovi]|uniref:Cell shape-determining protein MreC n=1 Tax=Thalassotalea mangrovi TaxID=2572245 RepID=A0A4U1BCF0_9GAMM|nr:rod shape-determining protein MreC [Thalassotalea mangrovi]TKB47874.1 rod shape-determining protein MreC [Thalassotalea mangrovi]
MNPIFVEGFSSHRRMFLALVLSGAFMYSDHKLESFEVARAVMQSMVSPLQYLANAPKQFLDYTAENLVSRKQLMTENQRFQVNELKLKEKLLQMEILQQENDRLRKLLASPVRQDYKKMVAEILAVDSDPYSHQVVINRGLEDGLYEGQPVVDDHGVAGQILHVGVNNSRVLLLTDISHAIPLRIHRNGIRVIGKGTGSVNRMEVIHVPLSTDIQEGDLLVTSGLGGKFPEGYPVAKVTQVSANNFREFAEVAIKPLVKIDRLRYLLLLWPDPDNQPDANDASDSDSGEQQKGQG